MEGTKIEWAHHTFNPWVGCTKVSSGCKYCYAEAMMEKRLGFVEWGEHGSRRVTSPSNWQQPRVWNHKAELHGERPRVFCASLADVFEDWAGIVLDHQLQNVADNLDGQRFKLFELIKITPRLDWLLLTKRPQNILKMLEQCKASGTGDNVWFGTSVENQAETSRRIPRLLEVPAAVRFLSVEPLLERVTLGPLLKHLQWVIVGGESGLNARVCHRSWIYRIIDECECAGVPVFVKQLGSHALHCSPDTGESVRTLLKDQKGGEWSEWPYGLRIRQLPKGGAA